MYGRRKQGSNSLQDFGEQQEMSRETKRKLESRIMSQTLSYVTIGKASSPNMAIICDCYLQTLDFVFVHIL